MHNRQITRPNNRKRNKKNKLIKYSNKLGKRKLRCLGLNRLVEKIKKITTKVKVQRKSNSKKIVNMRDRNLHKEEVQEEPLWGLVLRMKMMRLLMSLIIYSLKNTIMRKKAHVDL